MYMFDLDKQCLLKDVLLENLKLLGIRCRIPKKSKENEKENVYYPEYQIFQKPLHLLKMCSVPRLNGTLIEVPEFLVDACAVIERNIKTEGIFRRAGSTSKQRESKGLINQGKRVNCDFHVFDACSLVKHFFRELPQPLIPYNYHKILMGCLTLSTQQKQVEALLLACLLLPLDNLKTLAFFMEFLLKVSKYSDINKMNKKNLAIILTPTLMPAQEGRSSGSMDMTHNFRVLELLIENSEKIGVIPEQIEESLTNEKFKKKKRSGSLTRMITGLKKMVGNKGINPPDWDESNASTPGSINSLGKRKNSESSVASSMLAKKQRVLREGELLATPLRCRMHGYVTPVSIGSVVPRNLKKGNSGSPRGRNRRNFSRDAKDEDNKNSNIVKRCLTKKQKSLSKMGSTSSIGSLFTLSHSKTSLDRGLSGISWGRKKTLSNLFLNKSETDCQTELSESTIGSSDDSELITVYKSEYEDIKNRVTALEEEIEILNSAHSVQTVYERTLEESGMLNLGSTDHLARRLSKELKIRRSGETKVIRSPSARKIGSIRRRSKESLQRSTEQKTSLRRGRPNTLQSGLPSPANLRVANTSRNSVEKDDMVSSSTLREGDLAKSEWQSGDKFFARDYLLQKLMPVTQGRPSIVEIRNQNAGMVLEKAKLFNSLTESEKEEKEMKIQKRQSIRLENLRRLKELERDHITRTSNGDLKSTECRSVIRSQLLRKNLPFVSPPKKTPPTRIEMKSVKLPTPVIKECLSTRSPRSLAKTPFKTGGRIRATPIRALLDTYGTPRVGVRRSPRILARTLTSSPRPNP